MSDKVKFVLFIVLIVPVIAYFIAILACFVHATTLYFNPLNWGEDARAMTAFLTFVSTIGSVLAVIFEEY